MQLHWLTSFCIFGACWSQYALPPGTVDVPSPRPGDCDGQGPAEYVYNMSTAKANDFFPEICKDVGGVEVHFNNPCAWAHGQAQMTVAHFTKMCKGATRTIHWHQTADEWGYVNKGLLFTYVASPDGLPWPSSTNLLRERGVWYFPAGWLHGLTCYTPEEEGGCEFTIFFASPQAAEPNSHNLDTTMAQAPVHVAAQALQLHPQQFKAMRPSFAKAAHSIHYTNFNMTAPIVTKVARGVCEPRCPKIHETIAAPAALNADGIEQRVVLPGTTGLTLYRIRTEQFPFARTMSQERAELGPGVFRPMVWASADAILIVSKGSVFLTLEGGLPGNEAKLSFSGLLQRGDVAYLPNGRAFWYTEATGHEPAETLTVFNVGNWKSFEMSQSMQEMPLMAVMSNLHVEEWPGNRHRQVDL
mmetsp:Transcript_56815/g.133436  ORF Transcript_56815/g.133436 Transcript_56815/m.133436 type:complete len:414 (-) Transcript_56815:44-1285(-)